MTEYHLIWLENHPHRSAEWLKERLSDGFDVHHVDGNRDNNDPSNLVLIEHQDHMNNLHGSKMRRIPLQDCRPPKNYRRIYATAAGPSSKSFFYKKLQWFERADKNCGGAKAQ
jgi:hypothetical protein